MKRSSSPMVVSLIGPQYLLPGKGCLEVETGHLHVAMIV